MPPKFSILNPCSKRWSDLAGEGRKRFCAECQTSVHAIDPYATEEIEALMRESPGRLCGYLAEISLPSRSRRAVVVGALLTAVSPLLAQSGQVRFKVTDWSGVLYPGADISLLGEDDEARLTLHTDNAGAAMFTNLPKGVARFIVAAPGYRPKLVTVTISGRKEVKGWATLSLPVVGETVQGKALKKKGWWIF